MFRIFFLSTIVICLTGLALTAEAQEIRFSASSVDGVPVHVLQVPLNGSGLEVKPALAAGGIRRAESFESFLNRLHPLAAINGTFFSKRTLIPVGYLVANGKILYRGRMGTAIAFRQDGGIDFIRLPRGYGVSWHGYRNVLSCGPTLVWEGRALVLPRMEGFRDPRVLGQATRSALGVRSDNTLLLVVVPKAVSLPRLADIMLTLGSRFAINLDGGSSIGLSLGGRVLHRPGRALTNILLVTRKQSSAVMLASTRVGGPRGLDWRYTGGAVSYRGRLAKKTPAYMTALQWKGGKVTVGPAEDGTDFLEVAGSALPLGWHVELKADGRVTSSVAPPCLVPRACLPKGIEVVNLALVNKNGRVMDRALLAVD